MPKRAAAILLSIVMLFSFGCANDGTTKPESGDSTANENIGQSAEDYSLSTSEQDDFPILGLIIDDDGSDGARLAMYGFLRTAQTLCYAAKVFRAKSGEEMVNAVDEANEQGISALMIFADAAADSSAIERAVSLGMNVVVPYYECDASLVSANVVADANEYYDELARALAERMDERSLKSGRILVYGSNTKEAREAIEASIKENYPQFAVCDFTRSAADKDAAVDELADFILNNRDIKGIYASDEEAVQIAVKARSRAQKRFKSEGAPTPTPTAEAADTEETAYPTPTPSAQSEYTPNPALLTQITITIFGCGLSGENYALFEDNDIYALCIEPYYEAAAQSTMMLDRLVRGESIASITRVNRPIVYSDTADKYIAIYEGMLNAFDTAGADGNV